jgi:hypothetical protein
MKTPSSSTAVKNSNIQRQRLDTQCIQRYLLPLHRDGTKRPDTKLLHKFGTLDWRHWNADYGITIAQVS